jgi:hypothetical protein
LLQNIHKTSLGPGLILWHDVSNERGDIRFGTWNVRSLYRAGSARKLARYKLDLVGVHKVRWDKVGTVTAGK